MSALDLTLLLVGCLTAAAWPRRWSFAVTAALAATQVAWEGWYWHFVPLYLLLIVTAAWPAPRARWHRVLGVLLVLLAVAPWLAMPPVPSLPAPRGTLAVGSRVYRWVDSSRVERTSGRPDDRRNVIVQAWYPAVADASRPHAAYIDGLGRLPRFVSALPSVLMRRYDAIDAHARREATPAAGHWPVILFSPGYGAARAFYSGLLADLASRGFVVLALDHPYEAALTELANGQLVTTTERFDPRERDRTQYMVRQLAVREADLRFVLDQLDASGALGGVGRQIDTARVAAIGHSFGGATSVVTAMDDARVKAAANIDGTLYGEVSGRSIPRPLLLIESDLDGTAHSPRYHEGTQRLLANRRAVAYRFEIRGANHYSFTDVPFLFSWPARQVVGWWLGGARDAAETQQITADVVTAFLQAAFGGVDAVDATAHRHGRVLGSRLGAWPGRS